MKALCASELGEVREVREPAAAVLACGAEYRAGGIAGLPGGGPGRHTVGPLGGGFLSGKYRRGEEPPENSRIAEVPDEFEVAWVRCNVERNWRTLDVVGEISEETGKSYAQIALNWLLRQEGVTAPVIGARHVEQLEDNLGAAGWELSPEQVARLSEVSAIEDVYPYRMIREMQRV